MKNRTQFLIKCFLALLVILCFAELYLRLYWGFCDNVLMMANPHYEYIEQPNQNRFRFRHHIYYNQFSMRSPEIDTSAIKVLGFGDSIINGGVMVDQDSLATSLLSESLSKEFNRKVQVLNIGAGSWGPDNCFAYLKQHGNFGAKIIFLIVSSHDAYDNMDFQPVIDKVNRYESKQYKSAIWELINKYAIPRLFEIGGGEENAVAKKANVFNTGFRDFYEYCKNQKIPFFIYLHPDKEELKNQKYNSQGREILQFCKLNNIHCIQSLNSIKQDDYRGIIHMNHSGQRHMKDDLLPYISTLLKKNTILNEQ